MCQFLRHCLAWLEIQDIPLPQLQRTNNACITNGMLGLNISPTTLKRINFCRIWLRVTALSDICTLHGDTIDRNAWLGLTPMPTTTEDWPVQVCPHDKIWSLWQKGLSRSICIQTHRYVLASWPGTLRCGLGTWLPGSTPKKSPHRWTVLLNHSSQRLYIPKNTDSKRYHQLSTETNLGFNLASYNTRGEGLTRLLTPQNSPRSGLVRPTTDGAILHVNRPHTPVRLGYPPASLPAQSFTEFIEQLPQWKWELLEGAFHSDELDELGQQLLQQGGRLLLCSDGDGGAKANIGSFGWVIATPQKLLWECIGVASGWFANSFRSEGIGQLSLLISLETYMEFQIRHPTIPTFPPLSTMAKNSHRQQRTH
jgi:hypothetical protein